MKVIAVTEQTSGPFIWVGIDGDEDTCTPEGAIRAFPHLLREAKVSNDTELEPSASPATLVAALGGAPMLIVDARYWLWFVTSDPKLADELKTALIGCLPEGERQ